MVGWPVKENEKLKNTTDLEKWTLITNPAILWVATNSEVIYHQNDDMAKEYSDLAKEHDDINRRAQPFKLMEYHAEKVNSLYPV